MTGVQTCALPIWGEPTRLVLLHREELAERLGEYAGALLETLEDADRANPALEVLYEK